MDQCPDGKIECVPLETANDRIKRLSTQLDEMTDRLSIALDSGGIGIWDWFIEDNSVAMCLLPEDVDAVNKQVKYCLDNHAPYIYEFRLASVPGRRIIGRGKVYYRDGRPVRMIGVCLEATSPPAVCPILDQECPLQGKWPYAWDTHHDDKRCLKV